MSSENAKWDTERASNNEVAEYRCLDSGQGCGSGITEQTLSGDWTETTEGSNFLGYKVIQKNVDRDANANLLNADANGSNAGNGSISGVGSYNSVIGEYNNGFGGLNSAQKSEFEIIQLPETFEFFGKSFTHLCQ